MRPLETVMPLKTLMTLRDFQNEFSLSRSALYREVRCGRLRLTKVGRASRIAASDALVWLERARAS
jgi:hypothetical protein